MNFKNKFASLVKGTLESTQQVIRDFEPQKISDSLEKFQNNLDKTLENYKSKFSETSKQDDNANEEDPIVTPTAEAPITPEENIYTSMSSKSALGIIERLEKKQKSNNPKTIEKSILSTTIKKILIENHILTIAQLKLMTDAELLKIKGIGKKSLEEINAFRSEDI